MGIFDNPFDLNKDGRLDAAESFLEFMVFNEVMKEDEDEDDEDDDWQLFASNDIGIDPYDYDSYEDFADAVRDEL